MDKMSEYEVVAEVVRIEHSEKDDEIYLVFKIVNDNFKRRIKKNWVSDVDLRIIGKGLVEMKRDKDEK
jgi:hypothetical protein